jgi:hypothetical protein
LHVCGITGCHALHAGVTIDILMFALLWVAWLASKQYNRVLLHLSQRERLKITWGAAPEIRVVQAAPRSNTPTTPSAPRARSRTGVGDSPGGTRPPQRGLAHVLLRRGASRSPTKRSQIWAAWRGPTPEGADAAGEEPLLGMEEADQAAESVELSQAGSGELSPVRGAAAAGAVGSGTAAAHVRVASVDDEDDMTPRLLHTRLVAQHRQSLLSSALSSVHASAGARLLPGQPLGCWGQAAPWVSLVETAWRQLPAAARRCAARRGAAPGVP